MAKSICHSDKSGKVFHYCADLRPQPNNHLKVIVAFYQTLSCFENIFIKIQILLSGAAAKKVFHTIKNHCDFLAFEN